jgi:hypothetical protein
MINTSRSKNKSWNVGDAVDVGFLRGLKVLKVEAVKDGLPDIYTLQGKNGALYEFIPHNGLTRVD